MVCKYHSGVRVPTARTATLTGNGGSRKLVESRNQARSALFMCFTIGKRTMNGKIAGRVNQVLELLGGQPQTDDEGCIMLDKDGKVILTPSLITKEEALKLLDIPVQERLE